jgi:hypothetical protein
MSLYVEVRRSEDGNVITNATFPWHNFFNYGNGVYYVVCDISATLTVNAPGRNGAWIPTDSYLKYFVWLTQYTPPHSSGHSSGWT